MEIKFKPCVKNYFRNYKDVGFEFNAIPIHGLPEQGMFMYFPRPWLIGGLCTLSDIVSGAQPYRFAVSTISAPADQADPIAITLMTGLFNDLCFASIREYDVGNLLNYYGPGIQGIDFRYYLSKFLSGASLETPEQWYNTFIQPESILTQFWQQANTNLDTAWFQKYLTIVSQIVKESDLRLWAPPGIYTISDSISASTLFFEPPTTNADIPLD